ncbi:MAG TPA: hypothetical protein PKB03_10745 [Baekduia sp.]|nr:hypothetical protein [Baekduia sp.]
MRLTRTGTGKGDVIGTVVVGLFSAGGSTVDSCTVDWDGDPAMAALLPSIAFDEWLPNLRSITLDTEAGPGTLVGADAQQFALDEFDDWLAEGQGEQHASGSLLFEVLPIAERPDGRLLGTSALVVRLNVRKRRLWSEREVAPDNAADLAAEVTHRVLWDWVLARAPREVDKAAVISAMRSQCAYYNEYGIPSSFLLREIGTAPFATWSAIPESPLHAYLD